jgi:hypothetical protein
VKRLCERYGRDLPLERLCQRYGRDLPLERLYERYGRDLPLERLYEKCSRDLPLERLYEKCGRDLPLERLYERIYSGFHQLKTSPPTPLLSKERGDKAKLYRGEVIACTSPNRKTLYLPCGA